MKPGNALSDTGKALEQRGQKKLEDKIDVELEGVGRERCEVNYS